MDKKKLRILFLIESFIAGGAEKVLIEIANNLDPDKYDINVCSVYKHSVYENYGNELNKNEFKAHVKFRHLINNKITLLYILFNFLLPRFPKFMFNLFIGKRYDKVIAFYEGLPTYWIAKAPVPKDKKWAWLHTTTELSLQGKNAPEIKETASTYAQFGNIIAVSNSVANSFKYTFPDIAPSSISTIYNPINIANIQQLAAKQIPVNDTERPLFITIGRITEAKGYDRYLNVIYRLKQDGYVFKSQILGGGDTSILKLKITDLDIASHVEFLGHVNNPYPYIKRADWIICTSLTEGLNLAILESMILNKAILTTGFDAAKEIFGDNEYCIIVPNSEKGLYDGIVKILSNQDLQKHYENKTFSHPLPFETENIISKIETLLDKA